MTETIVRRSRSDLAGRFHPEDFHVVFRGSYELAHALAAVDRLVVSIFRSEGIRSQVSENGAELLAGNSGGARCRVTGGGR